MNVLPYKRVKVADGLRVKVSNYFFYTDFGVRRQSTSGQYGRRYVCTDAPGTGFIERETDSHSYREYVHSWLGKQHHSYWRLLTGKQPNFDLLQKEVRRRLDIETDPVKKNIMDAYLGALSIAQTEERIERIQRGIKDRIGHRNHNKYYVSVLSHYKHKVRQLEQDISSVELDVRSLCNEEQYDAWRMMVDAFVQMLSCRRIWNQTGQNRKDVDRVFFDLGVFDFIKTDCFIPIMRSSSGVNYFILPGYMLTARSSVDFDVTPIRDVNVVFQEMAIQESTEMLNSRLGDAASMLLMPRMKETWYFNHVRPIIRFVEAYNRLKNLC